ncbi:MAG: PucR family transcriptional regulator [Desulfitobacteriaceae bacterium]
MKQNDGPQQNGPNPFLLQELCTRLKQETGLEFSPWAPQGAPSRLAALQGDGGDKDTRRLLRFHGAEGEVELAYLPPEGEVPGKLVSRLLAALGCEIYTDLLRESKQSSQAWTWEKLLATAVEQQWDETVFEQKAAEYALPMLTLGFPVLIRCQNWHSEISTVIENLLPQRVVLWVRRQELFLFVRAEMSEVRADKLGELQVWGESLIRQIHTMLADELGVLASVCVGSPSDRGLWRGYQEVRRLVKLQARFFPGEAGLAAWKLGLAGLLGEISPAAIQQYRREMLKERLTPELLETLEAYFTHDLSISETARALFIHRNTLLYRLDRVTDFTGYNPREFAAAVQLYLAIWLQRHDKY